MDHISQLKKIRAEAIARLRNSPDFKLAGRLGQLIVELGDTVEDVIAFDVSVEADPSFVADAFKAVESDDTKSDTDLPEVEGQDNVDESELEDVVAVAEENEIGDTAPRNIFATTAQTDEDQVANAGMVSGAQSVFSSARPFESTFSLSDSSDDSEPEDEKMIDDLVAEIEGDVAELDAIMAETTDDKPSDIVSTILNTNLSGARYANGVSH